MLFLLRLSHRACEKVSEYDQKSSFGVAWHDVYSL